MEKEKIISWKNWQDWCSVALFEAVESDDDEIWKALRESAEEIIRDYDITDNRLTKATHHLVVDIEHLRPYVEEGSKE